MGDLGDPATLAIISVVIMVIVVLLGWPAACRVVVLRRLQRGLGTLYWLMIIALNKLRNH